MFNVHAVQAFFGDCLILEYGADNEPKYVLIDGGPHDTFKKHLKPALDGINGGIEAFELAMLSHVDNDHVIGLLDFLAEKQLDASLPKVAGLWHNSFSQLVDPGNTLRPAVAALVANAGAATMAAASEELLGIEEGARLSGLASQLKIPLNALVQGKPITVASVRAEVRLGTLNLRVVGPTLRNLAELRKKWNAWKKKVEHGVQTGNAQVLANADTSVPNLSSIMVLAEHGGRTALLTGDGRSDHLLEGLDEQGLLDDAGGLHVNLLKVGHHGSNRNHIRSFFSRVTADKYVISANGRDDNPDYSTLTWIVETADEDGRPIEICVTNETPSVKKLRKSHKPAKFGNYVLSVMPERRHWMTVAV